MHSPALPYGFDGRRCAFCSRRRQQFPTEKVEFRSARAPQHAAIPIKRKKKKRKALALLLP
jgi:hypothetical protein